MMRFGVESMRRGLALAALLCVSPAALAAPITYPLVTVGNPGNANDPATGFGGVNYAYQIGATAVTIDNYTAFLNAVAQTDTYGLYNTAMDTDLNVAGITRSGSSGSYTYAVKNNGGTSGNRPITYVNWFAAARFTNWMANGQPTGIQTGTTTENGAYTLNGATSGTAPAANPTNPNTSANVSFVLPTENEWYKAAYYDPTLSGGSGGYFTFATRSNTPPGNDAGNPTLANQANYVTADGKYAVTQSTNLSPTQNYLTDVGAFTTSASYYGTFDQTGNVYQWNDLSGAAGTTRGLRGGAWNLAATFVSSTSRLGAVSPTTANYDTGFRLVSPVPEPASWLMAVAGLAAGCGWLRRPSGRH